MNYAILLAAGHGLRLKSKTIKPLLMIDKNPLFLYSLNTFINNKQINQIVLVIPQTHIQQFSKYMTNPIYKRVRLVVGHDKYRHLSLVNAMTFLKSTFNMKPSDVIITHDIARLCVTSHIISNNIAVATRTGYASTVLPLHDSLCEITNTSKYISRDNKFIVQTPQSFQYKH
jgi:2-C-methyl-D-erythritol 4-phosphate cytidylyltransferase